MNITVYLGASVGNDPAFLPAVQELGNWIGSNGHALVYGGSKSGLMGALAEHGRRVPGDVSVVGFDDIGLAGYSIPPLTTVRQDFRQIGHELVRLVLAQLDHQSVLPLDRVVIPTEFVIRGSTAPPPS